MRESYIIPKQSFLKNKKTVVHYFLHKQSGATWDVKIKYNKWSSKFRKGPNKILWI